MFYYVDEFRLFICHLFHEVLAFAVRLLLKQHLPLGVCRSWSYRSLLSLVYLILHDLRLHLLLDHSAGYRLHLLVWSRFDDVLVNGPGFFHQHLLSVVLVDRLSVLRLLRDIGRLIHQEHDGQEATRIDGSQGTQADLLEGRVPIVEDSAGERGPGSSE